MTNWITSDLHLFHKRIIEFCPETRRYDDLEDMHDSFRIYWQNTVGSEDRVFILGDVSFGSKKNTAKLFSGLPGRIVIVKGNHDDLKMLSVFESVHDYLEVTIEMTKVCMFHFPIEAWHRKEKGSVHVHGHMHGRGLDLARRKDIGIDATGKWLTNLDNLVLEMLAQSFEAKR